MFKNKTEQNRNDGKYNQTGITVKIHTNHNGVKANMIMLKSIAACSSWRSLVITTVIPVILSDLHVLVNSAVVHSKNTRLTQFVFYLVVWKNFVFLWAVFFIFLFFIQLKFTEHFTSRFYTRYIDTSGKSVKFNLPNYLVCKLLQIVNFDGFWTLMVFELWWFDTFDSFCLVQPIRLLEPF